MLSKICVIIVWEIGSGTTYLGIALRTAEGGYARMPRDGLVDRCLATAGMSHAAPVATTAVKGESRKPDDELSDDAKTVTSGICAGKLFTWVVKETPIRWRCTV